MSNVNSDDDTFEEAITTAPSTSLTTPFPEQSNTQPNNKKRKIEDQTPRRIDESNITRFKVLRKLKIQQTRTSHHIDYLNRCIESKTIPKSLRVNLTPQVPVINSSLQIKWEEAHIEFGHKLCTILLQYWQSRQTQISQEIESIEKDLESLTTRDQIDLINDIISGITISVEKELSTKKVPQKNTPGHKN